MHSILPSLRPAYLLHGKSSLSESHLHLLRNALGARSGQYSGNNQRNISLVSTILRISAMISTAISSFALAISFRQCGFLINLHSVPPTVITDVLRWNRGINHNEKKASQRD